MEFHDYLTESFIWGEFWSGSNKGSRTVEPPEIYYIKIKAVAEELQKLRNAIGRPIRINSGWRSKSWNTIIGGSSKSKHLEGLAADIKVHIPQKELLVYVGRFTDFKGIGISNSFTHLDLREDLTFWYY